MGSTEVSYAIVLTHTFLQLEPHSHFLPQRILALSVYNPITHARRIKIKRRGGSAAVRRNFIGAINRVILNGSMPMPSASRQV